MRISYNWLKTYIDLPYSPVELKEKLTMAGLEVEHLEYLGEGLEDIIIGEITEVKDHENADKLHVCKVNCGDQQQQIVCGADNVKPGLKVPVALPGTTLPDGLKIKKAKLRGVDSEGMICSADELNLAEERQPGIMELEDKYEPGVSFVTALGYDDYVYKLDLTPNYSRCLGMLGVARELAALSEEELELKFPENELSDLEEKSVEIELEDPTLCPRYTARVIEGIQIGPSPDWMQRRLQAVGIRPINNVVDITNYVMLEYNQPLHAFDYDKLEDNKIIVRQAREDESLITLDGQERQLDPEVLVIADRSEPIGLAGVMGGEPTEVTEATSSILLESASFDPVSIRRTAKKYALPSESSHRFERQVDIGAIPEASVRAAYLLKKYAQADKIGEIIDVYPQPAKELEISLTVEKVNSHLGIELSAGQIKTMLEALGFKVSLSDNLLEVVVPTFRTDVEYSADLIEEVARVYGYNNIPYTRPASKGAGGRSPARTKELNLYKLLQGQGLDQIYTFSLWQSDSIHKSYLSTQQAQELRLKNPLSEAFANLRTTLVPGILDVLSNNARKQIKKMAVYETGGIFKAQEEGKPKEEEHLALASMGAKNDSWNLNAPDFFYLKGIMENIFSNYKVADFSFVETKNNLFHPGRAADIMISGKKVGKLGEIHPDLIEELDLPARTAASEIHLSAIWSAAKDETIKHQKLSRYPSTERDLALILPEEQPAGEILEFIKAESSKLLSDVAIFDYYQGEQIPEGKKSLAIKFSYLDREKTIKETEVAKEQERLIRLLKSQFEVEIRGN
ncbi:MAG: phenylalanine--tRNA ligase subunit beta [Bacillota bacterium]